MQGINGFNPTSPIAKPQGIAPQTPPGNKQAPFNVFMENALSETQQKQFAEQQVALNQLPNLNAPQALTDPSKWIAQVINEDELERIEQQRRQDRAQEGGEELTAENINDLSLSANRLEITPFQLFMDKAVDSLENISKMEFKVNNMIEQFIEGKVSIDEVSIEMSKLNLAISFATTVITTASQTFKEITQLSI